MKVKQNADIEYKLIETGDKIIAEANSFDSYWGNGKDQNSPDINDYRWWPGQNVMGWILINIRDEVTKEK